MLRLLALGGLGEVGMNCLALEQRGEILLVDCGVLFDSRGLGVDVVHPDFSPLDALGDRIAGIVITHGHEDHIGGLPYLLRRYDVPVWAGKYALGLVRERLGEHEVLAHARLFETTPRAHFRVGTFEVEPIRVTHSIADASALAIRTDEGVVVHTGDFKFDEHPPDGEHLDEARLRELGDEGVALLMSDSTNIDAEGPTGSESGVGPVLEQLVAETPGIAVVSMFASNIQRLRLLGDVARRTGRKLVLLGRSVHTHARVGRATGYLTWPDEIVWPESQARELPRGRILAVATGSQGEEAAALARLARGEHTAIDLGPGDSVILSARTIPGNEPEVYAILGQLLRRGVTVRTRVTDRGVHVSGHAHRVDQRRMLDLVRPRSFVPVHGTYHHLVRHAALAEEAGVGNVTVLENGRVGELSASGVALGPTLGSGRVHVWAGREIAPSVLRERANLAQEGLVVCVVTSNTSGPPDILLTTRGVVDESKDGADLEAARAAVRAVCTDLAPTATDEVATEDIRLAIRRAFYKARGTKPMTIVHFRRAP